MTTKLTAGALGVREDQLTPQYIGPGPEVRGDSGFAAYGKPVPAFRKDAKTLRKVLTAVIPVALAKQADGNYDGRRQLARSLRELIHAAEDE